MKRLTKGSWPQAMVDYFDELFSKPADYPNYQSIRYAMNRKFPGANLSHSAICGHAYRNGYRKGTKSPGRPKVKRQATGVVRSNRERKLAKVKQEAEAAKQREALGIEDSETASGRELLSQPIWRAPLSATVGLLELKYNTCRWPLICDDAVGYRWCKNSKASIGQYCLAHSAIAYRPPQSRIPGAFPARWGR